MLHLVGCLYYLYQWCTVKQVSDNEIYLLIKYIKSVLWRVSKFLSYIEEARCLKVKTICRFAHHFWLCLIKLRETLSVPFYVVHSVHYDEVKRSNSANKCTVLQFLQTISYVAPLCFGLIFLSIFREMTTKVFFWNMPVK